MNNNYKDHKMYGKDEAEKIVIELAKLYGFCNMIVKLKIEWKKRLMEEYNLTEEQAERSVNV